MKAAKTLSVLTLVLCALIVWQGITGIMIPGIYANETDNWRVQVVGQDGINLCLVVPLLLNTGLMISRGAQDAKFLWAGGMIYVIYTYLIYCFGVHFNSMFLVYCTILGLSIFSLIWFIYTERKTFRYKLSGMNASRVTAIFFMLTAVFFAMAWLHGIVPAILTGRVPESLTEGDFLTNPVHVIDLAVCLPGLFFTGLLLILRKKPGLLLAPILLTFMLLMYVTVALLSIQVQPDGHVSGIAWTMFGLAAVALLLLVVNLRSKTYFV